MNMFLGTHMYIYWHHRPEAQRQRCLSKLVRGSNPSWILRIKLTHHFLSSLITTCFTVCLLYLEEDSSGLISWSMWASLWEAVDSTGGAKLSKSASSLLVSEQLLSLRGIPDDELYVTMTDSTALDVTDECTLYLFISSHSAGLCYVSVLAL